MRIPARLCILGALLSAGPLALWAQPAPWQPPPARAPGPDLAHMAQIERQDFGVPPTRQLHTGPMHGPTPATIPGGQVVTTQGLVALVQGGQAPYVLFDVLGQVPALPHAVEAVWMSQPGSFRDAVQRRAAEMLAQVTQGRKDVVLVFYCQSRECWMSYNAALRAIQAGYTNVLWYRGGVEAWQAARLPMHQGGPVPPQQARVAPPGGAPGQPPQAGARPGGTFEPVTPVARGAQARSAAPPWPSELRIGQGRFFSFALPEGWRVGEDGQYALTLVAPDNQAMTVMVGNAGLPVNHPPGRFAYDTLLALRPQNLQLGQGRQARPAAGFGHAAEFDVSFVAQGLPFRGVAKVSMAPGYDSTVMAVTAALSVADQWPGYASWLPLVADQVAATNGAAFGRRGIMQQNLANSRAFGEAARQYREWSQSTWRQVSDERQLSQDRRSAAVRENLGAVHTYANPYGTTQPLELPTSHRYYWMNRQGQLVGTNDPGADPNVGSTGDWRRMDRVQP